jgi:hypothetical protein
MSPLRRTESVRERTLLRLIVDQQQMIRDLADRICTLSGAPPPSRLPLEPIERPAEEPVYYSALDGLPPGYEEED